jgi:hypothetical protein
MKNLIGSMKFSIRELLTKKANNHIHFYLKYLCICNLEIVLSDLIWRDTEFSFKRGAEMLKG